MNVFDQVFQYKILTKILPTNKYLKQYRVLDSDLCSRCRNSQDTIVHATMLCQSLVPYLSQINGFLAVMSSSRSDVVSTAIRSSEVVLYLVSAVFYSCHFETFSYDCTRFFLYNN